MPVNPSFLPEYVDVVRPVASTATPTNPPKAPAATTAVPAPSTPQCSDGIDNDGDQLIDYAAPTTGGNFGDPQCSSPSDNDESQ